MLKKLIFGKRPNPDSIEVCGQRDCACTGLTGKVCDMAGGIYLTGLGHQPSLDIQEFGQYQGDLYLPLATGRSIPMTPLVKQGQAVSKGQLLASDNAGHCLYAPLAGTVQNQTTKTVYGHTEQPVLILRVASDTEPENQQKDSADTPNIWQTQSDAQRHDLTRQAIEKAALTMGEHGETLMDLLEKARERVVGLVVANAIPLEPTLNGPLAILKHHGSEVFAGLSILKTFLRAPDAIVAYSYDFPVDCASAAQWNVRCAAVTEKYPQALPSVLLRSLRSRPRLSWNRSGATYIFDLQTLLAIERAVLANSLPLERIVTIAGDGLAKPAHFRVPIGLPLHHLLERAEITDSWHCVIEGASLTGRAVNPEDAVVSSRSNCFMVVNDIKRDRPERCIRCGWCIMDCPASLDPARLQSCSELGQFRTATELNVEACVECGICSYICPSNLPIMESIRMMKRRLHPLSRLDGGPHYG